MSETRLSKEEMKAAKKAAKKAKTKGRIRSLYEEFRKFISKGNVLDMAVGVIMGSAFNAIVTAVTSILLSICTWGVPGGLSGLVTVLPATNDAQRVPQDILVGGETLQQSYSASEWAILSQQENFTTTIANMYTKHGGAYYYNGAAIIDWGAFINAVISFVIIALTLFVIVKVFSTLKARRAAIEEQIRIAKAKKDGTYVEKAEEEREPAPVPEDVQLLTEIRDEIRKIHEDNSREPKVE